TVAESYIGNAETGTSSNTTYFEDVMYDWTNHIFPTFPQGGSSPFTVTTTGTPTPSLTETGTLPNGVTFTDNGNGTATLGGTPAAVTAGSYVITTTANNGVGNPENQTFTITVNTAHTAPAITNDNNPTFTLGAAATFAVTTTGTPTPALTKTGTLP